MTKQRRTITVSRELDGVIGLLATAKQMNVSEYLESRLMFVPEIEKELKRLQQLPDIPTIALKKDSHKLSKLVDIENQESGPIIA